MERGIASLPARVAAAAEYSALGLESLPHCTRSGALIIHLHVTIMPIPILVVDDEPNFLTLMKSALGKRGFDVNAVETAAEALKLLEKEHYDFALVDLRLGAASGIDLLAEIKRRQPRIRAIMVTGQPTDQSRSEAKNRGASAYLSKPLGLTDLLHTLATVLTQ